ncbi:hypothetical protein CAPTEDRAFT_195317 [Capitella teleta]|uniref:Uncharacterized protein n=1 Tax=Capitella teleta TaxID=283909 RepID=R7TCM6_CAPTE|nr:hypothetical protein CAPTEDRAFT_195317 [Capitella teleta]|eukprot:ELT91493.1 hypothetical protein CAPTEDRAFT_195317 [Capitella teleta]
MGAIELQYLAPEEEEVFLEMSNYTQGVIDLKYKEDREKLFAGIQVEDCRQGYGTRDTYLYLKDEGLGAWLRSNLKEQNQRIIKQRGYLSFMGEDQNSDDYNDTEVAEVDKPRAV